MIDIRAAAGRKMIEAYDAVAVLQKPFAEVRAEEPRPAIHKNGALPLEHRYVCHFRIAFVGNETTHYKLLPMYVSLFGLVTRFMPPLSVWVFFKEPPNQE